MRLVGPVLFYDLIRVARRGRYVLLRCLYACMLLLLMYVVYVSHFAFYGFMGQTAEQTQQLMAAFAEKFFGAFLAIQFLAVVILTPAYTAGAIAEEKQRKTIEYLFTTDLANHEIIFGKLASRIGNLTLFIITGLPILSMTQLFGGVSPMLLWCGFGATALTMLSLASLSILQSVYARRVRDAMLRTYLLVVGYFVGWGVLAMIFGLLTLDPPAPLWVRELFNGFTRVYNTGNPAYALYDLVQYVQTSRSGGYGMRPVVLLGYYALFHGTLAFICMTLSLVRLRTAYVRQVYGKTVKSIKQMRAVAPPKRARRLPPVSGRPMLWKELHAERGLRVGALGEFAFILIALACISPGIVLGGIVVLDWVHGSDAWGRNQRSMNLYVRWVGTILTTIISLGVGIRAAGCLAAERDKLTHETLMSSTFTNAEIFFAKWLGAVTSMRWVYALLFLVLLLAVCTGGLSLAAFPVVLLSLAATVTLAAGIGLWFASSGRTGLRAIMWTVVILLILNGGGLLLAAMRDSMGSVMHHFRATSPAAVHFTLSFWWKDVEEARNPAPDQAFRRDSDDPMTRTEARTFFLSFLGLGGFVGLSVLAACLGMRRFNQGCGRIHGRPRFEPIDTRKRIHT